ncbi:MAG: 2-oxoacid:acceptor oxidoreductase family protein, partial [Candidatus Marinimicrobia bacterium]|nr:2-oxoacid:acceptor oxidoreductase family protein [Candidatus Neomarinimicrobiota bacterium]
LNKQGEKVGAIKVRLYRPFSAEAFISAIPDTVKKIVVLDRTKEPGSLGEPLYLDVVVALSGKDIKIIGGRYGLSSKEFTPTMVKAVYDHLDGKCTHNFTVGIEDDVTGTSVTIGEEIDAEPEGVIRCKFWGYGSDGTVGANKNSIKIIGDNTDMYAQGYFQYDSKKSGGVTISHLRFGKHKIQSQYLLNNVDFVALHKSSYIGRFDILEGITEGGTFLLNSIWKADEVFENLTEDMQKTIIEKKIKVYNIDALKIAQEVGLGTRISTVMQAAFFNISGVLPENEAIKLIKSAIEKTFLKKGKEIVEMNWAAVDRAVDALEKVPIPSKITKSAPEIKFIPDDADDFTKNVIDPILHWKGDSIPVSKMPYDGR